MNEPYDVIVIGAGFAGLTAARELSRSGRNVCLLEGRDRVGGRTWVAEFAGMPVELGGTWIHWFQPHVWAEMTRYGIGVLESPDPVRCAWLAGGERREGTPEQFFALVKDGIDTLLEDAAVLLERPYEPLWNPALVEADRESMGARFERAGFGPELHDLLNGVLGSFCNAPARDGGISLGLRWYALSGWDTQLMLDCTSRYKLANGTVELADAIAGDVAGEVRLGEAVARVEHDGDGVTVTTRDGTAYRAATAIVTLPLNVLDTVEFSPALIEGKRAAAASRQASRGSKLWVRLRGELDHFFSVAPDDHPLTWIQTEYHVGGDTLAVVFGPDADAVDPESLEQVADAVRLLAPDVVVEEAFGHNWLDDEFSRGTWGVFRPGQLTGSLRDLQQREGRVVFAGAETADGWNGFIDGAIESGLRATREVEALLAAG